MTECDRPQPIGTIAKYKCKPNHIPFDGSDRNANIENELKCDKNGEWVGLKRYNRYRCKEGKYSIHLKLFLINFLNIQIVGKLQQMRNHL